MGAGAGAAGMPSMMPPTMAGGPIVMARNFAVMTGVNAGISAYLKQKRGVEDVQGTMIASFGSGAAFAVVSKLGLPPGTMAPPMPGMPPAPIVITATSLLTDALTTGAVFAGLQASNILLINAVFRVSVAGLNTRSPPAEQGAGASCTAGSHYIM